MNARQMWAAKLAGGALPPRVAMPVVGGRGGAAAFVAGEKRVAFAGLVLGVDPSLRGTGVAVIEFTPGRTPVMLRCATVRVSPKATMAFALGQIHRVVAESLNDFDVRHVALEQTIYVQNFQTAQILGAARGAAISAAALREKLVFEYPPLRVKQAIVGAGRASKEQMARTVMALLGHGRAMAYDEADAAGVALCHAFTWQG